MLRDDPDVQAVREAMFDPFEYLVSRHRDGLLKTDFKTSLGRGVSGGCHLRVQNIGKKTEAHSRYERDHGRALLRPLRRVGHQDSSSTPWIWIDRTTRRPPPSTFCASSCPRPCGRRLRLVRASRWESTIRTTTSRSLSSIRT